MIRRLLLAVLLTVPLSATFSAEELTEKNWERTRDFILPNEEEEAWLKVKWRGTFWDGVIDAQKEDKPIMLFAMNGHPFACT